MSFFGISIKVLHLEKVKNTRYEELTKFFVKYFITLTFTDEAFKLTRPFNFYFITRTLAQQNLRHIKNERLLSVRGFV